jgi:hypothetical protein
VPKNDATAVPAGFFDDALTEMQVRQVKIERPDFRNELKALERDLKQSVVDQNKVSEEFQQQLAPLRELEEKAQQSEYESRVEVVRERGQDIKRRLEEMRAARHAKASRTAGDTDASAAAAVTMASRASADDAEADLVVDWKTKAVRKHKPLFFDADQL